MSIQSKSKTTTIHNIQWEIHTQTLSIGYKKTHRLKKQTNKTNTTILNNNNNNITK